MDLNGEMQKNQGLALVVEDSVFYLAFADMAFLCFIKDEFVDLQVHNIASSLLRVGKMKSEQ